MKAGMTFDEMLAHNAEETQRWREFFEANPSALDLPLDIANMQDVRGMLVHIFAVELLYGEVLNGEERDKVSYLDFASGSVAELFSIGDKARQRFRRALDDLPESDWLGTASIGKPPRLTATRKKMFIHTMLHSVRHWAQLATALRVAGQKPWHHDFILSKTMK